MIEANNLLVKAEGTNDVQMLGCFCTRYIEERDIDTATISAIETVQSELNLQGIACLASQLTIESIEQLGEFPYNADLLGKGFTFYSD